MFSFQFLQPWGCWDSIPPPEGLLWEEFHLTPLALGVRLHFGGAVVSHYQTGNIKTHCFSSQAFAVSKQQLLLPLLPFNHAAYDDDDDLAPEIVLASPVTTGSDSS